MKKYTVFSGFDGMGGGMITLKELNIPVKKYYASEIDEHAIGQTTHNFPKIIHLGNIENWKQWNINWSSIDLIIAGSPCQGFSMLGKHLNFKDPRSKLFFIWVAILERIKKENPNVLFFFENVKMKQTYRDTISKILGIQPIRINSKLVSAQERDRFYWSNIKIHYPGLLPIPIMDITQPLDRKISLFSILEDERSISSDFYVSAVRIAYIQRRMRRKRCQINGLKSLPLLHLDFNNWDGTYINKGRVRRIAPIEACRLQTIPEWYEWVVPEKNIREMLGNGWTIEVIKHFFKHLK